MTDAPHLPGDRAAMFRLLALLAGNVALATGPWLVRLADTGPVAAGFWRLALAFPFILVLARFERRGRPASRAVLGTVGVGLVVGAGVAFALDLVSWHVGILQTRLGNASLFGNSGSLLLMAWGLIAARRLPHVRELAAIAAALGGAGLLMGGSLEISHANFVGDLLCLLAGLLYVVYLLLLRSVRGRMGPWNLLVLTSIAALPVMLLFALGRGEVLLPQDWTPLIALALASQVIGQGLLIGSLAWFSPLVIGVALLTQPAISAGIGYLAFGEVLSPGDGAGMVLMGVALVLARVAQQDPAKG